MNIIISGKQLELTDSIKRAVEEKLGKLDFYLNPDTELRATVSTSRLSQKIEVTIIPISGPIIRAEDSEESLYSAIDSVYDKLDKQLRKYKSRLYDRHQSNDSIRFENIENVENTDYEDEENEEIIISRHKKFDVKPMHPQEAILQMDLLGHDFYMFRNIESDDMALVYKRKSGGYGMIEHE